MRRILVSRSRLFRAVRARRRRRTDQIITLTPGLVGEFAQAVDPFARLVLYGAG